MELIIGIDDAGRGPLIGPMVLAGILIEKKDELFLKDLGVKDSKKLTPEKRYSIVEHLKKYKHHVELTFPEEIDSRLKMGINLNRVEAIKAAKIINELLKDANEKIKIIIDCPSPNTEAWKNTVLNYVDNKELIELSCEHYADANHISCSAASIIAKTTRDTEIEKIKKQIGFDFGSGYCADPLTCKFLEENSKEFENSGLFRKSWDTWTKSQAKKEQKKLF